MSSARKVLKKNQYSKNWTWFTERIEFEKKETKLQSESLNLEAAHTQDKGICSLQERSILPLINEIFVPICLGGKEEPRVGSFELMLAVVKLLGKPYKIFLVPPDGSRQEMDLSIESWRTKNETVLATIEPEEGEVICAPAWRESSQWQACYQKYEDKILRNPMRKADAEEKIKQSTKLRINSLIKQGKIAPDDKHTLDKEKENIEKHIVNEIVDVLALARPQRGRSLSGGNAADAANQFNRGNGITAILYMNKMLPAVFHALQCAGDMDINAETVTHVVFGKDDLAQYCMKNQLPAHSQKQNRTNLLGIRSHEGSRSNSPTTPSDSSGDSSECSSLASSTISDSLSSSSEPSSTYMSLTSTPLSGSVMHTPLSGSVMHTPLGGSVMHTPLGASPPSGEKSPNRSQPISPSTSNDNPWGHPHSSVIPINISHMTAGSPKSSRLNPQQSTIVSRSPSQPRVARVLTGDSLTDQQSQDQQSDEDELEMIRLNGSILNTNQNEIFDDSKQSGSQDEIPNSKTFRPINSFPVTVNSGVFTTNSSHASSGINTPKRSTTNGSPIPRSQSPVGSNSRIEQSSTTMPSLSTSPFSQFRGRSVVEEEHAVKPSSREERHVTAKLPTAMEIACSFYLEIKRMQNNVVYPVDVSAVGQIYLDMLKNMQLQQVQQLQQLQQQHMQWMQLYHFNAAAPQPPTSAIKQSQSEPNVNSRANVQP